MPYSTARMSILRWGEMVRRWKQTWREVSEVSQVTRQSWFTNFQRGNFSDQKAFCTSPQWNIYLFLISLFLLSVFGFLTPPFSLVWFYIWTRSLSSIQKYWEHSFLHTLTCNLNIFFFCKYAQRVCKAGFSTVACYMTEHLDDSGSIGVEFAALNVTDWSNTPGDCQQTCEQQPI